MSSNPRRGNVGIMILTWVVSVALSVCVGLLMTANGFTIEEYFWQRQLILVGIIVIPVFVVSSVLSRRK